MNSYDLCVCKPMSLTNSWEPVWWRIPRATPALLINNTCLTVKNFTVE